MAALVALAGCDAPASAAEVALLVGEPYSDRAGARIPVQVENRGDTTVRLAMVSCAFYDEAGSLIDTERVTFGPIAPGGAPSSTVLPHATQWARMHCEVES